MKQKTSANKQSPRRASLEQQNPGDEAPRGTPGTGEDISPDCKGRGRLGGLPCLRFSVVAFLRFTERRRTADLLSFVDPGSSSQKSLGT
jgi:hypothetical protein